MKSASRRPAESSRGRRLGFFTCAMSDETRCVRKHKQPRRSSVSWPVLSSNARVTLRLTARHRAQRTSHFPEGWQGTVRRSRFSGSRSQPPGRRTTKSNGAGVPSSPTSARRRSWETRRSASAAPGSATTRACCGTQARWAGANPSSRSARTTSRGGKLVVRAHGETHRAGKRGCRGHHRPACAKLRQRDDRRVQRDEARDHGVVTEGTPHLVVAGDPHDSQQWQRHGQHDPPLAGQQPQPARARKHAEREPQLACEDVWRQQLADGRQLVQVVEGLPRVLRRLSPTRSASRRPAESSRGRCPRLEPCRPCRRPCRLPRPPWRESRRQP
jgi:hypothetical protein